MATTERTKVAVIREPGYPMGEPAPCYLNCPCGGKPPAPKPTAFVRLVTCACGVVYDEHGWVVSREAGV